MPRCKTEPEFFYLNEICPLTVSDAPVGSEVNEDRTQKTEKKESEERRKKSLLAALEQIGREEEDEEEEFQELQQETDGVFSLNKCILGAVLLLALGTLFFSGKHHFLMRRHVSTSDDKRKVVT